MQLTIHLTEKDINTRAIGKHFEINAGKVSINFTPEAIQELKKDIKEWEERQWLDRLIELNDPKLNHKSSYIVNYGEIDSDHDVFAKGCFTESIKRAMSGVKKLIPFDDSRYEKIKIELENGTITFTTRK